MLFFRFVFGDGVEAAGAPRMATRDTAHAQPAAARRTVARYRLQGITGTAWGKPAVIS